MWGWDSLDSWCDVMWWCVMWAVRVAVIMMCTCKKNISFFIGSLVSVLNHEIITEENNSTLELQAKKKKSYEASATSGEHTHTAIQAFMRDAPNAAVLLRDYFCTLRKISFSIFKWNQMKTDTLVYLSSPTVSFFLSPQRNSVQKLHVDPAERGLFSWAGLRRGCQGLEAQPERLALLLWRWHPFYSRFLNFLPSQCRTRWESSGCVNHLHN